MCCQSVNELTGSIQMLHTLTSHNVSWPAEKAQGSQPRPALPQGWLQAVNNQAMEQAPAPMSPNTARSAADSDIAGFATARSYPDPSHDPLSDPSDPTPTEEQAPSQYAFTKQPSQGPQDQSAAVCHAQQVSSRAQPGTQPDTRAADPSQPGFTGRHIPALVPDWLHDDSWIASGSRQEASLQAPVHADASHHFNAPTTASLSLPRTNEALHDSGSSGGGPRRPPTPPSAAMQALEALIPPPFINSDSEQSDDSPQAHGSALQRTAADSGFTVPAHQTAAVAYRNQPQVQSVTHPGFADLDAGVSGTPATGEGLTQQSYTASYQPGHTSQLQPQVAGNNSSGAYSSIAPEQQPDREEYQFTGYAVPQTSIRGGNDDYRSAGQELTHPHEDVRLTPASGTPFSSAPPVAVGVVAYADERQQGSSEGLRIGKTSPRYLCRKLVASSKTFHVTDLAWSQASDISLTHVQGLQQVPEKGNGLCLFALLWQCLLFSTAVAHPHTRSPS